MASRGTVPFPALADLKLDELEDDLRARGVSVVAGGWLIAAIVAVLVAPRTARKLGTALATREGITSD